MGSIISAIHDRLDEMDELQKKAIEIYDQLKRDGFSNFDIHGIINDISDIIGD